MPDAPIVLDAPRPSPGKSGTGRPAIRLSGIRKEYRLYNNLTDQVIDVLGLGWARFRRTSGYKVFAALNGIDMDVAHGERVGLIGRNGAGKTTLLKLVTGNFRPTAGEIEVNGEVQALMSSGLGFHGEFTGFENIRSSLTYNGLSGTDLEAAIEDVVDFCELGDFLHQPVKTYSLGMRARLQFATATAIKPDIVIIDEVLGAGDVYFSGKSNERIKRLTYSGATLLIVSHSMQQILQFANRVVWLDQGKIVAQGEPLEIVNQYEEYMHTLEQRKGEQQTPGFQLMLLLPIFHPGSCKKTNSIGPGVLTGAVAAPLRSKRLKSSTKMEDQPSELSAGEPFAFVAEDKFRGTGDIRMHCLFVVYGESGEIVSRVIEPERQYTFVGKPQRVLARIEHNPIGQGKYACQVGFTGVMTQRSRAWSSLSHIVEGPGIPNPRP